MSQAPPHPLNRILANILYESESKGKFSASDFFAKWFRERGSAYFFLFRKNLKVTNIQFAELSALIRSHNTLKGTKRSIQDLQFLSYSEFREALRDIVDAFPRDGKRPRSRYRLIAELYSSLLSRHVVIDSFFGSCAVFIPPHLEIDLLKICANSGYIHSCGLNVWVRNIEKAKRADFFGAIRRHLQRAGKRRQRTFFTVYAHEDFKSANPGKRAYYRDGLDDVKVHLEKFYMDAERLVDVVIRMRRTFGGKLEIPNPGNFRKARKVLEEVNGHEKKVDLTKTLWLLTDCSIGDGFKRQGDDRFYICYEQLYMNENPFLLFDENKPAWLAPTTIPHTLVAAMMNVAGLSGKRTTHMELADPFVGTGTVWLESIKLPKIEQRCSDKAPIAPLLALDNLEFFLSPREELKEMLGSLESLRGYLIKPARKAERAIEKTYESAMSFFRRLDRRSGDYADIITRERVEELRQRASLERYLFYFALRTKLRNASAFVREAQQWRTAYWRELSELVRLIGRLINLKEKAANGRLKRGFLLFQGNYSTSCSLSFGTMTSMYRKMKKRYEDGDAEMGWPAIKTFDAMEGTLEGSSLEPGTCDVIITDPPYGFNTDDNAEDLARLYAAVIERMINALKDEGQMVLCLLDRSHTGRRSPFFTHKELITQQVLSIAEQANPKREVIIPAYAVPQQRQIFRAPYYWESERALRRAILHFRIRNRH